MKAITVWERFDPATESYKHNHIEWGHIGDDSQDLKPKGSVTQTANWSKADWMHHNSYLVDNKVVDSP